MLKKTSYILEKSDKVKFFIIFLLAIGTSLVELASIAIFQPFIELLMDPGAIQLNKFLMYVSMVFPTTKDGHFFTIMCVILVIVYVFKNVFIWIYNFASIRVTFNVERRIASRLFTTYIKAPYKFHLNKSIPELQRNIQNDVQSFVSLIDNALKLICEIMVCISLGVILFVTSKSMALTVIAVICVCVSLFLLVTRRLSMKLGEEKRLYKMAIYQAIIQAISGIKEIKVLNRERHFIKEFQEAQKMQFRSMRKSRMIAITSNHTIEIIAISGIMLAIILKLNYGVNDGPTFIAQLAMFAIVAFRTLPSVNRINLYINNITYSYPSLTLLYHDLMEANNIEKETTSIVKADSIKGFEREITIKNISYSYPNTDIKILDSVNCIIEKGKMVAFIGTSGAGKTTIVDIVLGLLTPQMGKILVDGTNILNNMSSWQKQIGYIPQSIYLSDSSIRANVAFGIDRDLIDEAAVETALINAQLFDFVDNLPEGLDTFVGDRGIRLSGGQRQRIGIARALYHNPEVLVLDEATSALDNETETAVMEAIESLHGIKTIIIIAHRLTTIKKADVIYEVVDGNIIRHEKI